MKFYHPLMHNNFEGSDMKAVIKLIRRKNIILTQSKYVKISRQKFIPLHLIK